MFYSMKTPQSYVHYMTTASELDQRGLMCTTVGYQSIEPMQSYPPVGSHPEGYYFRKGYGRRLPEYQIVYISEGEGMFRSEHVKSQRVGAGYAFLLFPNEWHEYSPIPEKGWKEYWVGFRGTSADMLVEEMLLSIEKPIIRIHNPLRFVSLFGELIHNSEYELSGYQLLCSGMVSYMLGIMSYAQHRTYNINQNVTQTIDKSQALMRQYIGKNISPEQIAQEIGVGYSWFRQTFRKHVGASPAQYQQLLRLQRAEFLLTNPTLSVADIAYDLGFANPNQFSTFFRQHKHCTPLHFRQSLLVGENDGMMD